MKYKIALIICLFYNSYCIAQVNCTATGSSGSGYLAITNAGLGIENPDCEHTDFGAHITQVFDNELDRNVFVFHSHIEADNDRCQVFDRVRMEIKGGPNTPAELQHTQNSTSYYRWKFKLDENFVGASSFNHIFQNKAKGGNDDSFPVITITPRANVLELNHNGGDTGSDLGVLVDADLNLFRGKWIEAYMKQIHSENGTLEVTLKDMNTGLTLLEYTNTNIDLWRNGADYNRPKWGMYRAKNSILQDEQIRFSDFCISEVDSTLCPAEVVLIMDQVPPTAPTNLMVINISMNTVELTWDAATDLFGVTEYLVLLDGNTVEFTPDTFITIDNLNPATTYTFSIQAKDAAGNISLESNTVVATTDTADVLPDMAFNPNPEDGATNINSSTIITWESGNNTDSFKIYFGTTNDPPLIGTQTDLIYQPSLAANTTYFWRVIALNINGESSSSIWEFTTGDTNSDFPWQVYRANERPEIETNFLDLNTIPLAPPVDEVISDPNGSTNSFYGFRSNTGENFRWRHDFTNTDSVLTIVTRLRAVDPDVNGICYFEIQANGWRQKIRLNQSTIKLEKTTPVVEVDLPFDLTEDMHLFRIISDGISTSIYLDENTNPIATGLSDTPSNNEYFEWGNSGGTDYGAYIDWLTIDKTGGFIPNEGTPLPSDLFLNSIATLATLELDGTVLNGFSPTLLNYNIELEDNNVPNLSWTTTSPLAEVNNNSPTTVPNTQATLLVTAQDGFTNQTYTLNYVEATNIENMNKNVSIQIFPNPVSKKMNVVLVSHQKAEADIYNILGQKVRSNIIILNQKEIDVTEWPIGNYILKIKTDGGPVSIKQFTIK